MNALEYLLIPSIIETVGFIEDKLSEFERGNLVRLMRIKEIIRAHLIKEVRMSKRIVALVVSLVFLLGVSFAYAQGMGMKKHHPEAKINRIKARVNELTAELKLKPEQGAKIKEILARSHNEAKAILEEAKAKIREIRVKAHDEIKALLTEEQKKKFQEIRQKHETVPEVKE